MWCADIVRTSPDNFAAHVRDFYDACIMIPPKYCFSDIISNICNMEIARGVVVG